LIIHLSGRSFPIFICINIKIKSFFFYYSTSMYIHFQEDHQKKAVLGIFGEEREVNKVTGRLKVVV